MLKKFLLFDNFKDMFSRCTHQNYLIFTINSDVCFYPHQQEELRKALSEGGINPMHITVHSEKGHDSFLVNEQEFLKTLKGFIDSMHIKFKNEKRI